MLEKYTPEDMKLSDGAAQKILSLSTRENTNKVNLRVFVTGGGCSGFQYGFSLTPSKTYNQLTLNILYLNPFIKQTW